MGIDEEEQCIDAWTGGATLNIALPNGTSVQVLSQSGKPPTLEEIKQAILPHLGEDDAQKAAEAAVGKMEAEEEK